MIFLAILSEKYLKSSVQIEEHAIAQKLVAYLTDLALCAKGISTMKTYRCFPTTL